MYSHLWTHRDELQAQQQVSESVGLPIDRVAQPESYEVDDTMLLEQRVDGRCFGIGERILLCNQSSGLWLEAEGQPTNQPDPELVCVQTLLL